MRRLREALRDNARDIERAVRDFTQAARILPGATGEEVDLLKEEREAFFDFLERGRRGIAAAQAAGVPTGAAQEQLRDEFQGFLDFLESIGIDVTEFRNRFDLLLEQGLTPLQAIDEMLAGGLSDILDKALEAFGNSVDGAVAQMEIFQRFLGQDFPTAFDEFLNFLLKNVEGLSDEARALLEEALGLDLSKEEDRERAKQIGAAFAQAIVDNDTGFLDGLSKEDAEKIADIFLDAGLFDPGALTGSGQESAGLQVQRVITDVQANAVVRGLEVIAHWTRRTAEILEARLGEAPGRPPRRQFDPVPVTPPPLPRIFYETQPVIPASTLAAAGQSASSGRTTIAQFGDVHLDVPFDPSDPEFARACGQALEEHIRRSGASPFRSF